MYGPYAADGFFGSEKYKQFDGVLAMYHDQGLVAFKSIAFGNGVNFTAGLSEFEPHQIMELPLKLREK